MKIKCIIIDDEALAIKVIKSHLREIQNMELVGSFSNPIEALTTIEEERIDVIFLDINMPMMNGLEFLKSLSVNTHVIITTAYREYGIESYDLNVLDYLLKPIPFGRFLKAINKVTQRVNLEREKSFDNIIFKEDPFIFLKVDKKLMKVKLGEILYIESLKEYVKVVTIHGDYLVHKSMTSIVEELPKTNFLRIHRSFTIAIDKIKSVEGNSVEIANRRIPIGRNYVLETKKKIFDSDL